MKISYQWLQDFLDIPTSPEETADLLTFCGLEVEKLERVQSVPGGLKGLVVGEVLSTDVHPNADRLKTCSVSIGNDVVLPIVCGAPNVAPGQKVVVATVGAKLYPAEGDPFTIKKSKIRGEASEGMICAEDEIGLGDDHDGIMVLDQSVAVGTPAADHFGVTEDAIIEIGLTPNRADATSHLGVARDLLAVLKTRGLVAEEVALKVPTPALSPATDTLEIPVTVENEEACPRYAGLTITGVKVGPSPDWLKNRMESIGVRSINNVVDVTNYVLHEMGQPLHAFDADHITGNEVRVKPLPDGTAFVTLDEVERKLTDRDLMICNAEAGMCIAGVFGGLTSGITESSTKVFLESAYFNPVWVRKTAKRFGLNTDASFRFERGIDPNITVAALKRAAEMIVEVAGGSIASGISDTHPEPFPAFDVAITWANVDRMVGASIDREKMQKILQWLEIEVVSVDENGAQLKVPPFKVDVLREIDVIEEILRVYGYNEIEFSSKLTFTPSVSPKPDPEDIRNMICDQLVGQGYTEIMSNSLTRPDYYNANSEWNPAETVHILNPLSSELEGMRQSLIFDALEAMAWNQNRQREDLKYFEFGNVYAKTEKGYKENQRLLILTTGRQAPESWNADDASVDFFGVKGAIEAIFARLGIDRPGVQTSTFQNSTFEYGLEYRITGQWVARVGLLSKELMKRFDLRHAAFVADMDWDRVLKLLKVNKVNFSEIPRFPSVRRDLALLVSQNVEFEQIRQLARKTEKKLLKGVNLFDVYQGKNLEAGKKSYAVSFTFQDANQTLTDKQVDKVMGKMLKNFERELGASLR
ncbi:MAG: phenylalanine--tRNA ligase subunit beta [Salibacteraceae bacterium]